MAEKTVVGLGEVLWDIYPEGRYPGGAPANVAAHARRFGARGVVVSGVGEDEPGEELAGALATQGLETRWIQKIPGRSTGSVKVTLNEQGIPSFVCSSQTAFDFLSWNGDLEHLASEADAVITGTLSQRNAHSRRTIQRFFREAGRALRVLDVNFRDWTPDVRSVVEETLPDTDILKLNDNEMDRMRRALAPPEKGILPFLNWLIREFQLWLAVLTLGENGCLITDGENPVLSPGFVVKEVDTTGCGDAFMAAVVCAYLEERPLDAIAEEANALAAFVATRKGAVPPYTPEEFSRFRETHQERRTIRSPESFLE